MATENGSIPQISKHKKSAFKVVEKIDSLSNINWMITSTRRQYLIYKQSNVVTKSLFGVAELCFLLPITTAFMFLVMCLPFTAESLYRFRIVKFIDDFLSHQLEFVDKVLESKKCGTVYRPEEGYFFRVWRLCYFLFCLAIFLPKLTWEIIKAVSFAVYTEIKDIGKLFTHIFEPATQVRRSTRRRKVKSTKTTPSSPEKKRKRPPSSDGEIEEYLYIDEHYNSEEDPDFSINDELNEQDNKASDSECESEGESDDRSNEDSALESDLETIEQSTKQCEDHNTEEEETKKDEKDEDKETKKNDKHEDKETKKDEKHEDEEVNKDERHEAEQSELEERNVEVNGESFNDAEMQSAEMSEDKS